MEKEIGKLNKNENTDIVLRIDDFGGKRGLTIREFVTSDRYTGFTKAGTRISPENFRKFKEMINSISEEEMEETPEPQENSEKDEAKKELPKNQKTLNNSNEELPDY